MTMSEHDQMQTRALPVTLVPTPTDAYRKHRKLAKVTVQPGQPVTPFPVPLPIPKIPLPRLRGSRVLIYKQDPSTAEIGIRKAYIPRYVADGPKDARIVSGSPGLPPVSANAFGDFIILPPDTDAFDAVHTYAVVRMTLTMYERFLYPTPIPWAWNSATNQDPLNVFPHGLPNTMNAYYSRTQKAMKFGDFNAPGTTGPRLYTCRSLDIVSHETGHAILDGLKPKWIFGGQPPQTGGLHESFADLTAIFLALSQLDQVEAVIAQTKANLHDKTFLSDLAEQFGLALGRPNGLRNADNNLKLSEAGTEVHAISNVFTGAIYDILADLFLYRRNPAKQDDAARLYDVGQELFSLVFRAFLAAPDFAATYADVANQMLTISASDGQPVQYRNSIRNRFTVREVVVSPTPLTEDYQEGLQLEAGVTDATGAVQDRSTCCGTMRLAEYLEDDEMEAELASLTEYLTSSQKGGKGNR
jgi:hypothetical protein